MNGKLPTDCLRCPHELGTKPSRIHVWPWNERLVPLDHGRRVLVLQCLHLVPAPFLRVELLAGLGSPRDEFLISQHVGRVVQSMEELARVGGGLAVLQDGTNM